MNATHAAAGAAILLASLGAAAQGAPDAQRAAAVLASNCANCHGTAGRSAGAMPSLAGLSEVYFVQQMQAFREGKRPATIMHQLSKGYTDEQVQALAAHFARLPK